ncbi:MULTISPECIES: hypothetical protein [unclassified Kitasatospora]|uniref:hypothetical protein n=1 Tax=unclassified Kitasatospora TaxID=2633591 RepID=UPI0033C29781
MEIIKTEAEPYSGITPNKKQKEQLADLGEQLKGKFADFWGTKQRTLVKDSTMRIDLQGRTTTPFMGANIQAQTKNSTIAAVRLADTLGTTTDAGEQAQVEEAVKDSLDLSAATGKWINITRKS